MADEVTKKDLQAVQNDLNKQIAELKKLIEDRKKEFNNALRGNIEALFEPRFEQLENNFKVLAKAISDVAKKVAK